MEPGIPGVSRYGVRIEIPYFSKERWGGLRIQFDFMHIRNLVEWAGAFTLHIH
jgi:hypothetical protein